MWGCVATRAPSLISSKKFPVLFGSGRTRAPSPQLFLIFMDTILGWIGASPDTWQFAKTYLVIVSFCGPFATISNCYSNVIRAEGQSGKAMMGQVIGNLRRFLPAPYRHKRSSGRSSQSGIRSSEANPRKREYRWPGHSRAPFPYSLSLCSTVRVYPSDHQLPVRRILCIGQRPAGNGSRHRGPDYQSEPSGLHLYSRIIHYECSHRRERSHLGTAGSRLYTNCTA